MHKTEFIQQWHQRSIETNNDFEGFIYNWISFNAFYSKYKQRYERGDLDEFVKDKKDIFIEIVKESQPMQNNLNKLKHLTPVLDTSINARDERTINDINNLEEVILTIYRIRCNLFHGEKLDTIARDKDLVRAANKNLNFIIEEIVMID